jgi:uncharacterized heparinase superfamily protein
VIVKLRLIYDTVRHLRLRQVLYRIRMRAVSVRFRVIEVPSKQLGFPIFEDIAFQQPCLVGPKIFHFLSETHELSKFEWDTPALPMLWRYHLQYFDDLNAKNSKVRFNEHVILLNDWIDASLPLDHVAWSPYPTSLRIVNWIKWLSRHSEQVTVSVLRSLARQADILEQRVEYHLLGNHLIENARALIFAGAFLNCRDSERWLNEGLKIIDREFAEQFLSDGGHFERSPMYQGTLLWGMLDLIELAQAHSNIAFKNCYPIWVALFKKGLRWLDAMTFPDGEIAFFNDAAYDVAPTAHALRHRGQEIGICHLNLPAIILDSEISLINLESTGYARVDWYGASLIADMACVGPDYLPGHAHADSLSFEFVLDGVRVFVNSGTSTYEPGFERQRQRSTAAHNTVEVDGKDSSEVWAAFRVARRAYPQGRALIKEMKSVKLECSHTGYLRLPGKVCHTRTWVCEESLLEVEDILDGVFRKAEANFLLHPTWEVVECRESFVKLKQLDGREIHIAAEGGILRAEAGTWHPRFGTSISTTRLVTQFVGSRVRHCITW